MIDNAVAFDQILAAIRIAIRVHVEAERAACEKIARYVAQCDGTARGAALVIADMIATRKEEKPWSEPPKP